MISTEFRERITVTTVITGQTPANYIQSNLLFEFQGDDGFVKIKEGLN